jgi:hypothetical protein
VVPKPSTLANRRMAQSFLALLQFSPAPASQPSVPSWQWAAAWFAIGAALAGAAATLYAQHRNRVHSITPKVEFFRDPQVNTWILRNYGQGTAAHIRFGELDANNVLRHYIELTSLARDKDIAFLKSEFSHCITLVAKYTDTKGRKYYAVCNGEKMEYPRRDPYPEWAKQRAIPESQFKASIRRSPSSGNNQQAADVETPAAQKKPYVIELERRVQALWSEATPEAQRMVMFALPMGELSHELIATSLPECVSAFNLFRAGNTLLVERVEMRPGGKYSFWYVPEEFKSVLQEIGHIEPGARQSGGEPS